MKKSKLITLLSLFSKEEMKLFEKFILSPYFNNGRNFRPLFRILKSHHPDFDSRNLSEESIFKKLYPGKAFDKKSSVSLRVLESQLSAMAERFLEAEGFKRDESFRMSSLLSMLRIKNEFKLFKSYFNKFKDEISSGEIGKFPYQSVNLILSQAFHHEDNRNDWMDAKENAENVMETFVCQIISKMIWYRETMSVISSRSLPDSNLFSSFLEEFNFEKFMESIEKKNFFDTVSLQLLYYSYRITIDKKDEPAYFKVKELFYRNKNQLAFNTKIDCIIKMLNFCLFQELGKRDYYEDEYIEINKTWLEYSLEEKINTIFGIRSLRNIIRIMISRERTDELKNFIENYSKYFEEELRDDVINYALAKIAYKEEKFDKCIELTGKCNFTIPMMIKDIKVLKMQAAYEMKYYDLLHYEIDAYRHFLSRSEGLGKDFVENDKLFLNYLKKLALCSEKKDLKALELLKKELKLRNSHNILLNWILQKIECN